MSDHVLARKSIFQGCQWASKRYPMRVSHTLLNVMCSDWFSSQNIRMRVAREPAYKRLVAYFVLMQIGQKVMLPIGDTDKLSTGTPWDYCTPSWTWYAWVVSLGWIYALNVRRKSLKNQPNKFLLRPPVLIFKKFFSIAATKFLK